MMFTDNKRLNQILKNLLSNAFKFTAQGSVTLNISLTDKSMVFPMESLNEAKRVIAFSVKDTGIGIPESKQKLIFEAFQQADGTTSRKYGGTGLGLSLARKLGGDVVLGESAPNRGSTFEITVGT